MGEQNGNAASCLKQVVYKISSESGSDSSGVGRGGDVICISQIRWGDFQRQVFVSVPSILGVFGVASAHRDLSKQVRPVKGQAGRGDGRVFLLVLYLLRFLAI